MKIGRLLVNQQETPASAQEPVAFVPSRNIFLSPDKEGMIEPINHQGHMLALILRANYHADGIQFFTPNDFSQQLGYMNRPKGYVIPPHVHHPVAREVHFTKEVLFIRSGKVRVDFYDDDQGYLESRILKQGDVVLLAFGGHGFEMLEASEIIEVKQGPYAGEEDKVRFSPVSADQIRFLKQS